MREISRRHFIELVAGGGAATLLGCNGDLVVVERSLKIKFGFLNGEFTYYTSDANQDNSPMTVFPKNLSNENPVYRALENSQFSRPMSSVRARFSVGSPVSVELFSGSYRFYAEPAKASKNITSISENAGILRTIIFDADSSGNVTTTSYLGNAYGSATTRNPSSIKISGSWQEVGSALIYEHEKTIPFVQEGSVGTIGIILERFFQEKSLPTMPDM